MSTVSHALTTTTKVKLHLGISVSTYDTLLEQVIAFVTDYIEGQCGSRRFKETTYSDKIVDGNGGRYLYLPNFPVSSITSIYYRSGLISSPTWNLLSTDEYLLNSNRGEVDFLKNSTVEFPQYWKITYVAGYKIDFANEYNTSLHTLPFDICYLATALCAKVFNNRTGDGFQSLGTEGQNVSFSGRTSDLAASLTPELLDILRKYQSFRLGC